MTAHTYEVHANNIAYTWRENSVSRRSICEKGNRFILNNADKSSIKRFKRDHMELYTKRKEVR